MKNKLKKQKPKVMLAMSGGVDSSVAALLLKKQGYDVVGVFMKNWSDTKDLSGHCAWRGERKFAIQIAAKLDIPLITLDFEKEYRSDVVDKMFDKYKKGITPNPDIDCNQKIKFPLLLCEARKRGINLIATGHYVRRKFNNKTEKFEMLRGKDESKDQSYFLYRMKQNELKNCLFPIGDFAKAEIREIARRNKFPNYDKKGTVGICFIGKVNLKDFLQKKIKPRKGKILDPDGKVIGEHDGIFYYTIGQRLGPRYGFELDRGNKTKPKKWYVARKDSRKNIIVAAPEGHPLNFRKEIFVKNIYFISDSKDKFRKKKTKVFSRIRHVGELLDSKLFYGKKSKKWKVVLRDAITGVSEGQAIVLYSGEKVLGGGEIGF